jgi:hypothetical protein
MGEVNKMDITVNLTNIVAIQKLGESQAKTFTGVNRLYTAEGYLILEFIDKGKQKTNFYNKDQIVWFNINEP